MGKAYHIGFCCGSFDLIHPGVIKLFKFCSKYCDYLNIGLQIDPHQERKEKTFNTFSVAERKEILSSIKYVNQIDEYETEKDLLLLLKEWVKPDVRFLGSDYIGKEQLITGYDLDIPIIYHQRNHFHSTTNTKKNICRNFLLFCKKTNKEELIEEFKTILEG